MENAFFIDNLSENNIEILLSKKYDRIYYGDEFCGRNIPNKDNLSKIINFCLKNDLKFTFLTPFVTEFEFEKLINIFDFFDHEYKNNNSLDLEISVNDFGVFNYIKQNNYYFKINMGRLLTHQKKDPDFFIFRDKINTNNIDELIKSHIKGSQVDSNEEIKSFVEDNFYAIEIENTFQGFQINTSSKINLFYPMISIATTRYCLYASNDLESNNATQYINCKRSCKNDYMINQLPDLTLYLKGNTQFYYNSLLPNNLNQVSRLINYNFINNNN